MRIKANPKKVSRADAREHNIAQAKATKRNGAKGGKQNRPPLTAGQSQAAPRQRKAQNSMAQSSQPDTKDAMERSHDAKQRHVEAWHSMQDGLDIDFEHWDAADIAREWNMLAGDAVGDDAQGQRQPAADASYLQLSSEDLELKAQSTAAVQHAQQPQIVYTEEIARAAVTRRKSVAIPDDELNRLGLSSDGREAPVAAELFWAGEELMDIGGGRFYPCRYLREQGDMPVGEWMQKEAQGVLPSGDYEVTAIVDERRRQYGRAREFIVKWKGFELNPEQWMPYKMLVNTKAMEAWAQKQSVCGQ